MNSDSCKYVNLIKTKALDLGFATCGISEAGFLEEEARTLEKWLNDSMHGSMSYMENNFDKRVDPRKLFEDAKSVISVLFNYFPGETQKDPKSPILSKYAYGKDYHFVLKDKLRELLKFMNENIGEINGQVFVDSAPVLDKAWAARSGLGWIGKNTNLLVRGSGSFFFIGELIADIKLPPDTPENDHCGNCSLCIDSCPTGAILAPRKLDARRCISYLTIEYREQLPVKMKNKMQNRVFGCDICQDVCPWNKNVIPHNEHLLEPEPGLLELTEDQWHAIDHELFKKLFTGSAVQRAGYKQIRRNLEAIK